MRLEIEKSRRKKLGRVLRSSCLPLVVEFVVMQHGGHNVEPS